MPIILQSNAYTDQFGITNSFYKSNVGDDILHTMVFTDTIRVVTGADAYLVLNPIDNILTWTGGNWALEGFRVGDNVSCNIYSAGGALLHTWTSVVTSVTGDQLDVTAMPFWIVAVNNEVFEIHVISRPRQGVVIDFNHVANGQTGNEFSLIDGEVTRLTFDLTTGSAIGVPVGNQSGQFIKEAKIKRIAQTTMMSTYSLTVRFVNSAIYSPQLFLTANCVKFFYRARWQSILGEPFNLYEQVFSFDADTGYFDEPFNLGIPTATLIQGVNEIDYSTPTTFSIFVDSSVSILGIGSAYISDDEDYYKNRSYSQTELSMIIPTTQNLGLTLYTSFFNEFGAGYYLKINAINVVGTTREINVTFIPNSMLETFMDNRVEGDRLFKLWIRSGNVNLIAFNDQLTKQPPVGGPLKVKNNKFLDHSENTQYAFVDELGYEANIEDDLAFTGTFRIPEFAVCQYFVAKIVARNSITNDDFTLASVNFNFSAIPMVGGKYILNESIPVISTLPTTSVKRIATLELYPPEDFGSNYGVHIHFPFLYRWEYWLDQTNAPIDFYPNQNRNWFPYGNTGDWHLELNLELSKEDLAYTFSDQIEIKNYDSDPLIKQQIELYIDSTNQNVDVVTEGMLMRVVAYHTILGGNIWEQSSVWGMITIEPKESAPRWICSTVVPFDNNSSNPLTPLTGLLCDITFPTFNVARLECYFDPNKVNLENGVKFTTKIKGCQLGSPFGKKMTNGNSKKMTTGFVKQIS